MNRLEELLHAYKAGTATEEDVLAYVRRQPFEDMGIAKLDTHREIRSGYPEVIFGQFKTPDQVEQIARHILEETEQDLLITRATQQMVDRLSDYPQLTFNPQARIIHFTRNALPQTSAFAAVVTAGTADLPVASECALTARAMGISVKEIHDVGVSGLHRLFPYLVDLQKASAIAVVAGMEGALTSVVAGLTSCPVVGVPTSVGYGAHFGGLAPLLSMINSCANRVSVVNIDNGFGAGCILASIVKEVEG